MLVRAHKLKSLFVKVVVVEACYEYSEVDPHMPPIMTMSDKVIFACRVPFFRNSLNKKN